MWKIGSFEVMSLDFRMGAILKMLWEFEGILDRISIETKSTDIDYNEKKGYGERSPTNVYSGHSGGYTVWKWANTESHWET